MDGKVNIMADVDLIQNVASSSISGVEFELRASLWDGGFLSADWSKLKNEIDSYQCPDPSNPGQIIDLSSFQVLDLTPEYTLPAIRREAS